MWPPVFCCHNLSNFETCHSRVFRCLISLFSLINLSHWSMISLSKLSFSCFIHVSLCMVNMARELLMDLTLSFRSAISAFLIICLPLGVFILLFSLILTGIRPSLRHLRENLLWFEKSAILSSNFSQHRKVSTFSCPYSEVI